MAQLKNLTISDTGYSQLPTGTTAQRPSSPTVGMMRFNTDTREVEIYTSTGWQSTNDKQVASGGTVTSAGGYTIHTFTTVGTSYFTPSYSGVVDVLVVGGGGAGASGIGGGGGAGGLIYSQGVAVTSGSPYAVVIGGGGASGSNSHGYNDHTAGSPSSALGITATGGGAGVAYPSTPATKNDGGSGGGGPGYGGSSGMRPAGTGTTGQGHPGGLGVHWPGTPVGTHYGGGGGGGAGGSGNTKLMFDSRGMPSQNAWDTSFRGGGAGGDGLGLSISGTATYYAGGGGAGNHGPGNTYGYNYAAGGKGGGGNHNGSNGNPGTANTGSGGASAYYPGNEVGGAGGSGIVIIRYKAE